MVAPLVCLERVKEALFLARGPLAAHPKREAQAVSARHPVEREDLVAIGPGQAAQPAPRPGVQGVDAALAGSRFQAGRVLTKPGNHPRRTDKGSAPPKAQAARPGGKPRDGAETPILDHAHFPIAAVVHPKPASMQPSRVRPRQSAHDWLAPPARQDDPPPLHPEVALARAAG